MESRISRSEAQSIIFQSLTARALARNDEWWKVYETSFPPEEREPRWVIERGLDLGAGLAIAGFGGARIAAIGAATMLRAARAILMSYMAVEQGFRGLGIGGRLMEFVWEASAERMAEEGIAAAGMVWEVEIPALAPNAEEARLRNRRIEFYLGNGAVLLSRTYYQPPIGTNDIVPMHLMFRGAPGAAEPEPAMQEDLVRGIYREKYGEINGIDSNLLDNLLRGVKPGG